MPNPKPGDSAVWRHRLPDIFIPLLLGLLAFSILVGVAPHLQPNPVTDSGIFLYVGDKLANGSTLYVDAWDHKGPVIFYINALGLLIGGGSRWGVWFLELLAVVGATLLGYRLMRKVFGRYPAIFGSVMWLISLPKVLEGGNLTEEYGLLLQFAAIWFFVRAGESGKRWQDLCVGLLMGLAFWMRANIIGIPLAILLVLLWSAWRKKDFLAWRRIGFIVMGFFLVSLVVVIYFASQGALGALWDGAFYYNLVYSDDSPGRRLASIQVGLRYLSLLQIFAISGWLLCIFELVQTRSKKEAGYLSLLPVLIVAGPIELVLVTISGRAFPHYFMSWLPIFGLLSGYFLWTLIRLAQPAAKQAGFRVFPAVLSLALLFTMALSPILKLLPPMLDFVDTVVNTHNMPPVDLTNSRFGGVLQYIAENTKPNDEVLFWGKLLAVNWLSDRDIGSNYIFQDHFFTPGYASPEMIQGYIDDIEAAKPLIIDSTVNRDYYPPIETAVDELPEVVQPLYDYLQSHYVFVEELNRYGWWVYQYEGDMQQ